jgi:hypothetical protein
LSFTVTAVVGGDVVGGVAVAGVVGCLRASTKSQGQVTTQLHLRERRFEHLKVLSKEL